MLPAQLIIDGADSLEAVFIVVEFVRTVQGGTVELNM